MPFAALSLQPVSSLRCLNRPEAVERGRRLGGIRFFRSSIPVALLFGILLTSSCGVGGGSDLESLPVQSYLAKPGDFLGNRYVLRTQIDEQLRWEKDLGRVLAVIVEGSQARLPVFVPDALDQNLHVGQRYQMEVIVEEGGLIYVETLRKY